MMHILNASYSITGSWGEALILLSLAVNIALIPVYHLAESWQEEERKLQRAMQGKLDEIKEVFKGRERYMYIRALYRLHGYSPLYSLRTSCGLFIQIPFFFAAFHLLNSFPDLAGASFFFIKDLALPDGLIKIGDFKINLLPFVMTAVNIMSAKVYTSRLSQSKMIQVYGLAAVFLVLLYTSTAALLIYWTFNNLFSLAKNLVYTRFIYADTRKENALPAPMLGLKNILSLPWRLASSTVWQLTKRIKWLDILLGILSIILLIVSTRVRKKYGLDLKSFLVIAGSLSFAILALAIRLSSLKHSKSRFDKSFWGALLSAWFIIFLAICALTSFKKLAQEDSWIFYRMQAASIAFFATWCFSREPFYLAFKKISFEATRRLPGKMPRNLFIATILTVGTLVFWHTPINLYASDPNFFYEPLALLSGRLLAALLISFGVALFFYSLAPKDIQPLISVLVAWAASLALFFTFIAHGDFGPLDGFIFQDPAMIRSRLGGVFDALAGVLCFAFLFLVFYKNKGQALISLFRGLAFILLIIGSVRALSLPPSQIENPQEASARLPEYSEKLLSFSPEDKNVVIIMLDMFTGGHMEKILEEEKELMKAFEGFVWYPDTMATGSTTILSVPSMLGGHEYTPYAISHRENNSILEEMHKGMAGLPELLADKDYSLVYADVDALIPELFEQVCPRSKDMLIVGKSFVTDFTPYWRYKNNLPSPLPESLSPFMASVGFFYAAPWTMRQHIYAGGSWMNTQSLKHNPSEGPLAFLELMPEISNTNSKQNTFRYMASQLTHYPWRLDKDSCMPLEEAPTITRLKNGMVQEHYYNERCALRSISKWLDWLKKNNLYDNTQIIIASDHSAEDSYHTGKEFFDLRYQGEPWKPHALLMVKSYGAKGEVKKDNSFMSVADIPWLVCKENGPCPERKGVFDPLLNNAERIRTHDGGKSSLRRHGKHQFNVESHQVKGTMFDRDNWEVIQ